MTRAKKNHMIKLILETTPGSRKSKRWNDSVERDANKFGVRNLKVAAQNRLEWRQKLRHVDVVQGL